jgi:hypothetical protein
MEPNNAAGRRPPGTAPVRAWTKTIHGAAYTIKQIENDTFGIWRDVEELGTFELRREGPDQLRATYVEKLSLEARSVVDELVDTYFEDREGPAKRD